jgi:rhamnogalacturonyl hydrolase YesR
MNVFSQAAVKLHDYITRTHWDGNAIIGPDPTGKINWRISRFIKSYLSDLPWKDEYAFLQGQAYWVQANLHLAHILGDDRYADIARACADYMVHLQLDNGAWRYPDMRERRHLIATVEGVWASLGLISAYKQFGDSTFLQAVRKWYDFQVNVIGFERYKDSLAINYFDEPTEMVPNNTTMLLWLVAELYDVTQDQEFLEYTDEMIRFLEYSQLENGELEYAFRSRPHFMCYQYNSFQFLDLAYCYESTHDQRVRSIMEKMARFLATGLTERGSCKYNCFKQDPEINYWTVALATALRKAHEMELGSFLEQSERAYQRVLSRQNDDGSFSFSERNYKLLRDDRSYARYLAMILRHLLYRAQFDLAVVPVSQLSGARSSLRAVDRINST